MYEDAMDLINSRSEDIQNDRNILNVLSTSTLSIPDAWDEIVHIRNGAIRHAACRSFLKENIGEGEVRQAGDIRIIYVIPDATICIPGENDSKRQILVSLNKVSSLVNCPDTTGSPPSQEEKELDAYISLLKNNGSIPAQVRLRGPGLRDDWSDLACYLYYFFILRPADIFQGRAGVDYWEALQATERLHRKDQERETWSAWNAQRNMVSFFKKEIFPKLLPFELPIVIQVQNSNFPAEKFFSLAGC